MRRRVRSTASLGILILSFFRLWGLIASKMELRSENVRWKVEGGKKDAFRCGSLAATASGIS